MPTVSEVCKEFAKTTTISGLYFIAKYKSCTVKLLWVFITFALIAVNIYQSYLCIQRFLSHPTKVTTILSHGTLTFPAVTFCSTNPYVSGRLTESTAPELKKTQDALSEQLYGTGKRSSRKKRTTQACPAGWDQVDQSCYFFPNKTGNWSDAINYCGGLNSTLPIFRNMTDFFNFRIYWDNKANNSQTWLGLKYDKVSMKWNWLNNCSFMYYPDFWHKYWNWDQINPTSTFFAKFNTILWNNEVIMKGAEPTIPTDTTVQVVCYKEIYDITQPCFSFEQPNDDDFLCTNGWWCANENSLGQIVSSAVNSDSCFCINQVAQSFAAAVNSCESLGGFLTDIRNDEEMNLLLQLIDNVMNNESTLARFCPNGFTYLNQSCFWFSGNKTTKVATAYAAESACQTIYNSHAASVHSIYELWLLGYLMMSDPVSIDWVAYWDLGMYIGGYQTSCSSSWQWTDGSPFDYIFPKKFPFLYWPYGLRQPDCDLYLGIAKDSGLVQDSPGAWPFGCRKNISIFPIWINYVSNTSYLDCNATCASDVSTIQPGLFNFNVNSSGVIDSVAANLKETMFSICRKDRTVTVPGDFCLTSPFCDAATTTSTTTTTSSTTAAPDTTTVMTTTSTATLTETSSTTTTTTNAPSTTRTTSPVPPTTTVLATTTTTKIFTTSKGPMPTNPTTYTTTQTKPPTDVISSSSSTYPSTSYLTTSAHTTSSNILSTKIQTTTPKPILEANGLSAVSDAQEKMLYESREMNEEDLSKLSYTLKELLSICTYNGTTCDTKKFKKAFYPNVGNCYTFNYLDNPLNVQTEPGANFGLSLILKLNISTYLLTSLSPGFLLVVHHQNETIFPDSQSLKVIVGYRVDISVVMSKTSIQPWPYSDCTDTSQQSSWNYSVEVCQRLCQQENVIDQCGCGDPALPSKDEIKICKYEQKPCVDQAKANSIETNCDCPPSCKDTLFTLTSTFTKTKNSSVQEINPENAAYVKIFYKQLSFITCEQHSAYDIITFISDLSNWFGLYLGFSAITLFEVFPFLYYLHIAA